MYKYTLEKYHGTASRFTCPNCNARRVFVRYVDMSGNHLADDVGKCDRESKCSFHKKPKEYFAENPGAKIALKKRQNRNKAKNISGNGTCSKVAGEIQTTRIKAEFIPVEVLLKTLRNYQKNAFVNFLQILFPENFDAVQNAVKDYRIGTTEEGKTVFWQIDRKQRIRTGKIIAYDAQTGNRRKEVSPDWIHAKLKRLGLLKANFNLKQCFFGEHLLSSDSSKTIAIVEAEKTAVVCSIIFPGMIWLAIGAKGYLTDKRFRFFANRNVLLFPDADAYAQWKEKAVRAQRNGYNVRISGLIETLGTALEKENGWDLADYLINAQIDRLERHNEFVDRYNAKLDMVLNDEKLYRDFETTLEEQKSILMIDGGLSCSDAEAMVTVPGNVRSIVLSLGPKTSFW